MAALLVAGCAPSANGTLATASRADTLTLATPWEPDTLDPLLLNGSQATTIENLMFSYLLNVDNDGNPVPDIAATVPSKKNGGISRDGLTITYHLRRGVRWSDGAPLNARDVAFSFAAIMSPDNNTGTREGYDQIASLIATDAFTVVLRLKRPYSPILLTFFGPNQNYAIIPAHVLRRLHSLNRAAYNAHPVGSGPYMMEHWSHGDRLVLVRNPHYYGRRPAIEHIVLKFIPNAQTILTQLQTGEIDGTLSADVSIVPQFAALKDYRIVRTPVPVTDMLGLNTADPILSDQRVRRAFVTALDLPRIVRDGTYGVHSTANAPRGLFEWSYDPSIPPPRYDRRGAAALLDAAGWRLGADALRHKNGVPLQLQMVTPVGSVEARIATEMQAAEAVIGIGLVLRTETMAELYATHGSLFGGKFQTSVNGIINGPDPETVWFLTCAQRPPNGFNFMRYCNKAVDDAEAAGLRTFDRAARVRDYDIVQRRVAQDMPLVPLFQADDIDVVTKRLRGFVPSSEFVLFRGVQNWSLAPG